MDVSKKNVIKGFGSIIGLIIALVTINQIIDFKINKKIYNNEFLSKIAIRVRPFAIFNANGSIIVDKGAMEYLENIEVIPKKNSRIPRKIILSPKKLLEQPPIITSIDQPSVIAKPERSKGIKWEYICDVSYIMEPEISPDVNLNKKRGNDRYKIEIIK